MLALLFRINDIKAKHDIDSKDVSHFHLGDKVKILVPPAAQKHMKGKEVIFRGSLTRSKEGTPMVSVGYKDKYSGKRKLFNINVNNVEKVSDATEGTKKIVSKGVEKTDIEGNTTLVDTKKKKAKRETSKEAIQREEVRIEVGSAYQNKAGQHFTITRIFDDSGLIRISATRPKGKFKWRLKKRETTVSLSTVKTWMKKEGIKRVPAKQSLKKKDSASYHLEMGKAHIDGLIIYDETGKAVWADTPEAREFSKTLITDNLNVIDRAIARIQKKYTLTDDLDVSSGDFFEGVMGNLAQYNPYKGNQAGGVTSRMNMYLEGAVSAKLLRIQEERMINQSIEANAYDPEAAPVEKVPLEPVTTTTVPGGGYVDVRDQQLLEEGLSDERDVLDHYFGIPLLSDMFQRWLGLGRFESDLTTSEAATLLQGLVVSKIGKPLSYSVIKEDYLPAEKKKLIAYLKSRGKTLPELEQTFSHNVRLRNKIKSKKEYSDSKDDIPAVVKRKMKVAKKTYDGGKKARAVLAARLITYGVHHKAVGDMVDVVEKILNSKMVPEEYHKEISVPNSIAIERTLAHIYNLKSVKALPRTLKVSQFVLSKFPKPKP